MFLPALMVSMIFVFHDVQTIPNGRDESSNHGFRDRNSLDSFSGFVANSIQGEVRPSFSALREWASAPCSRTARQGPAGQHRNDLERRVPQHNVTISNP